MTNDRTRVVTMAQELGELLPEQMSRLGNALGILVDLVNWAGRNAVFDEERRAELRKGMGQEVEEVLEFEEIVDRARELLGGKRGSL